MAHSHKISMYFKSQVAFIHDTLRFFYKRYYETFIVYLLLWSHGAKHPVKTEVVILLSLCSFSCVRLKSIKRQNLVLFCNFYSKFTIKTRYIHKQNRFFINLVCWQDSHLLCFGECYCLDVAGWELDVFAEASIHQWAHSAKDPDVSLYDKSDILV